MLGILVLALTANSFAAEMLINCENSSAVHEARNSEVVISDLVIDQDSEMRFCFDPEANKDNKELIEDFKMLEMVKVFDKNHCIIEKNREGNEALVSRFIQKNLENKIQIFAVRNKNSNQANLIYTNSENKNFVDNSLKSKDKWQIAGFSATSIAVGALVSENIYKGQADKRKHWMTGAAISGVTTGATYLILETAGVGDKLNLSKNTKKNLIMLSGPIMGTIVGILKEIYDTKHRNVHTPDINDAAATSLGAGGVMFAITFAL